MSVSLVQNCVHARLVVGFSRCALCAQQNAAIMVVDVARNRTWCGREREREMWNCFRKLLRRRLLKHSALPVRLVAQLRWLQQHQVVSNSLSVQVTNLMSTDDCKTCTACVGALLQDVNAFKWSYFECGSDKSHAPCSRSARLKLRTWYRKLVSTFT